MTMYLDHFGLREAPFKITPHTEFFFAGAKRGETLDALVYAITAGEGIVKVVGEVGSGKTMLCRVLMERLPPTVETIYLAVPSLTRDEMIGVIAGDLGIETQGANTTKLMRALQEKLIEIHSQGKQVVALIDEAHAMPLGTLEEIRLLSNLETNTDKLLQIVLFGQPELDEHLSQPNMRQLKERITHAFNLLPLPPRDIKDYLNFRLRAAGYKGPDLFAPEIIKLIAEASEGLTRRINIYADKTLLAAFASGTHTITADHARAAISDTQITLQSTAARRRVYSVLAAGLAGGLVLGFLAGRYSASPLANLPQVAPHNTSPLAGASAGQAQAASSTPSTSPGAPGNANPPSVSGVGDKTEPKALQSTASPTPTATQSSQDWLTARIESDRRKLDSAPSQNWSIQLMTADQRERQALENYLAEARRVLKPDGLLLVSTGSRDLPRISVIYGEFANRVEAQSALTKLPQGVGQFRPYVRTFQAIREDMRRTS